MSSILDSVRKWIINDNNTGAIKNEDKIDWLRAVPFILINLSCFLVFWVGFNWIAFGVAVALYYLRLFSIGAFYHRYFSHKTFKTNRFWQFIFAILGGLSAQRGALWWAAHHRQHHLVSDQVEDAHSPVQHGFWWSHIGWFLSSKNYQYNSARIKDWLRYPELIFLDRYDVLLPTILFVLLWIAGAVISGVTAGQMLVWGFAISTTLVFHTTVLINSLCHIFGTRRYDTKDNSRNNLLFALLTLGEGWHNNHHYYPASANQGFRWWEIDITYYIIKLLEKIGVVWDVKKSPKHVASV